MRPADQRRAGALSVIIEADKIGAQGRRDQFRLCAGNAGGVEGEPLPARGEPNEAAGLGFRIGQGGFERRDAPEEGAFQFAGSGAARRPVRPARWARGIAEGRASGSVRRKRGAGAGRASEDLRGLAVRGAACFSGRLGQAAATGAPLRVRRAAISQIQRRTIASAGFRIHPEIRRAVSAVSSPGPSRASAARAPPKNGRRYSMSKGAAGPEVMTRSIAYLRRGRISSGDFPVSG